MQERREVSRRKANRLSKRRAPGGVLTSPQVTKKTVPHSLTRRNDTISIFRCWVGGGGEVTCKVPCLPEILPFLFVGETLWKDHRDGREKKSDQEVTNYLILPDHLSVSSRRQLERHPCQEQLYGMGNLSGVSGLTEHRRAFPLRRGNALLGRDCPPYIGRVLATHNQPSFPGTNIESSRQRPPDGLPLGPGTVSASSGLLLEIWLIMPTFWLTLRFPPYGEKSRFLKSLRSYYWKCGFTYVDFTCIDLYPAK